ncbi:hypothetical protein [Oceanicella actignis]|uniref:Uncharacterized protein n=1 Tax=Oceanicella actignis TaxID=1189325 RepID=A0A1M7TRL8_9RHOB|nr:hypothetical protein [Oceanicella actignis]TYO85471.1 hypothetical protein LY05_02583 [Oceanicella actignis]SET78430.1 hypothetical protein SAMN04488119_109117 [Oceanicella actignis]SHN73243.1 hypothetical protein SAMN05216200_1095 [Oceanicella actignis]
MADDRLAAVIDAEGPLSDVERCAALAVAAVAGLRDLAAASRPIDPALAEALAAALHQIDAALGEAVRALHAPPED